MYEHPFSSIDKLFYPLENNKSIYIGTVSKLHFSEIKRILIKHKFRNILELIGNYATALYFEHKKANISALIFSPIPEMLSLNQKFLNFISDFEIYLDIINVSEEKKLEDLKKIDFWEMLLVFNRMLMEKLKLSPCELDDLK